MWKDVPVFFPYKQVGKHGTQARKVFISRVSKFSTFSGGRSNGGCGGVWGGGVGRENFRHVCQVFSPCFRVDFDILENCNAKWYLRNCCPEPFNYYNHESPHSAIIHFSCWNPVMCSSRNIHTPHPLGNSISWGHFSMQIMSLKSQITRLKSLQFEAMNWEFNTIHFYYEPLWPLRWLCVAPFKTNCKFVTCEPLWGLVTNSLVFRHVGIILVMF